MVDKIEKGVVRAFAEQDLRDWVAKHGGEPISMTQPEFVRFVQSESKRRASHQRPLISSPVIDRAISSFRGQLEGGAETGGSPYGATTIADNDMSRQPSVVELNGAEFQGKHAATAARSLFG